MNNAEQIQTVLDEGLSDQEAIALVRKLRPLVCPPTQPVSFENGLHIMRALQEAFYPPAPKEGRCSLFTLRGDGWYRDRDKTYKGRKIHFIASLHRDGAKLIVREPGQRPEFLTSDGRRWIRKDTTSAVQVLFQAEDYQPGTTITLRKGAV